MTTGGAVFREQYYLFWDPEGRELWDHQYNKLLASGGDQINSESEAKDMLEKALAEYRKG